VIRRRDLPNYVGLQRTQIDELISRGEFPPPIKLSDSGRTLAWLEHEVLKWQQHRIAKRDADLETKPVRRKILRTRHG
jgi:predicted DNA-binding transcriptional regulator AlpA